MEGMENFKVEVTRETSWDLAKEFALATMGREFANSPTSEWKAKLCRCEHSPLRTVEFKICMTGLPSFVSVHLVRHKYGKEDFVMSQRSDLSAEHTPRHKLPQDAPVMHKIFVNAAEILFISRRRLCNKASPETRFAWNAVVSKLREIGETELADACVPECVYRGYCPEFKTCGQWQWNEEAFAAELERYRAPCAANMKGKSLP